MLAPERRFAPRCRCASTNAPRSVGCPRDPTLIPTELTFDAPEGISVAEIVFPQATDVQQDRPGTAAAGLRARVRDWRSVRRPRWPLAGIEVPGRLRYQACDDRLCYPPVTADVLWTLTVVKAAPIVRRATPSLRRIAFGTGARRGRSGHRRAASDDYADGSDGLALLDEFTVAADGGYPTSTISFSSFETQRPE